MLFTLLSFILLSLIFIPQTNCFAADERAYTYINAPYFSGWKPFYQPNQVSFIGSYERDHFDEIYRTETGHTFVRTGTPECPSYEYASLDASGDFIGSGLLVGVHEAPSSSYMLTKTGAALAEITAKAQAFQEEINSAQNSPLTEQCPRGRTKKIGILLVEFSDRPHVEGFETMNLRDGRTYPNFYWGQTTENIPAAAPAAGAPNSGCLD